MILHIEVTERDITSGVANNARFCPVARAVRRVLRRERRSARGLWAGPFALNLGPGNLTQWPTDIKEWIKSFDALKTVQPIAFDLELSKPPKPLFNRSN